MAYLAMARKWRPMTFDDLVGQEHIAQTFRHAIEGNRLHHAFLFTGTRGIGKTTSARILARSLNCLQGDPLHPCGTCASCQDIAGGNPMDVFEIDAASHTSVDDIREILEQVKYAPMHGKYKVFVIDEVHMLSKSAFNALLKTLEEPPDHVIFIFATTEVHKVPQTILSRIQRFDFKRIGNRAIAERLHQICLKESISDEAEALALIADKADGSMRDALTFFDQVYAFSGQQMTAQSVRQVLGIPPDDLFFDLVQAVFNHDQKATFLVIDSACNQGIELQVFLEGFAKFLRNMLYSRVAELDAEQLELPAPLFERLRTTIPEASNGDLLRYAKIVSDTQMQIKQSSTPRLVVETALARLTWLDRVVDLKKALLGLQNNVSSETEKKKDLIPDSLQTLPQNTLGVSANVEISISQPSPPTSSIGEADDITIDFEESTPSKPQISRFEIVNRWKQVCQDFVQAEPLAGAYLENTILERGEFNVTPFPLKIVFRYASAFAYQQYQQSGAYQQTLQSYLETIIQNPISLSFDLLPPAPGEENPPTPTNHQSSTNLSWKNDLTAEPILQILTTIFETDHIATRKLRHTPEIPPSTEEDEENDAND